MSVLFLGPLPEPVTGHSLACQILLDELVKHYDVEVVNLNKSEFKQGISSFGRVLEVLSMVFRIWRKRNACSVVYFTISESVAGNLKDLMIYLACFRRLPKMAIHLHGGAGMKRIMSDEHPWLRRMNQFFVRRMGAVIVLGSRHVGIYARAIRPEKIHAVPNFAQDYVFSDAGSIERKFGEMRPLRILFLSNLLPGKGHLELAQAVRLLDERDRSCVQVDFAGGFESEEQKQAFLNLIDHCPQMRYHGTVRGEAKRQLLAQAHVLCLPTYYPYEGQPISILEAYASGCAVITTDHSGILDIFSNSQNGYEVPKESAAALKSAIERALASPHELRDIALFNWNMAQHRYRTSVHTRELLKILAALHDEKDLGKHEKIAI